MKRPRLQLSKAAKILIALRLWQTAYDVQEKLKLRGGSNEKS